MENAEKNAWYKSTFSLNVFVIFLYYLFARISFAVAIPPGNVSPIYPAAGIAVVSIILWGPRILPAVLIGSFLANWSFYLSTNDEKVVLTSVLISFLMGFGPVIQTYLAYKLFIKFGPEDKVLKTPKDIIAFAILLSPLSCVAAATWGNFILWSFNLVGFEQLIVTWLTWWVGDTAGVIVLSPLVLMGGINNDTILAGNKSPLLKTIITVLVTMMFALVGSWYLTTYIQGFKKIKIGISQWDSNSEYAKNIAAFKAVLATEGYIEGKNIEFYIESPKAQKDVVPDIIKRFIDQRVNLIFVQTTPATLAAKKLTETIPIVFSVVTYPVEAEVIKSMESSGNNLVGSRNFVPMQKQYHTFKRLGVGATRFAFVHRKNEPNSTIQLRDFEALSQTENIEILDIAVTSKDEIFDLLEKNNGRFDAVFSACDTLVQTGGEEEVIRYVSKYSLPDFACLASGIQKGSLIGNVADFVSIGTYAGDMAVKILRGVKPSSLASRTFDGDNIIVNMKRAAELKIKISKDLLEDASEVVR